MKNHKQLLMNFYLELLKLPYASRFRIENQSLYAMVVLSLARELGEATETVQNIFERMAAEDGR